MAEALQAFSPDSMANTPCVEQPLSHVQLEGRRPPGLPQPLRLTPQWEALRRQIYRRAIQMGTKLSYDFRELLTEAKNAQDAGALMWQLIKPFAPEVLVGPGMGATPLLYSIALAALADGQHLQVLMVRDKRKAHNQKRWVEGYRKGAQGKRAVFVDDFMSAGSALPLVKQALLSEKLKLNLCAIALFFDTWEPLGSRQISVSVLPVLALFTRHDLGLSRDSFDAVPPTMRGKAPDFVSEQPAWWRFALNLDPSYALKCVPVIGGESVFVADDQSTMWCHDLSTGEVRWSVPSLAQPSKGVVQLLQHVDHSVVYGCYDGTITRLDDKEGEVLWRWKVDSSIHATPSVDLANQRVFINTEQWCQGNPRGHLQCLDWETGRLQWKLPHGWWPPGSTAYTSELDTVYAPCNDQSLMAVNAGTGALVWKARTRGLVRGRPALAKGKLLVATEQSNLVCLDAATGASLWSVNYGQTLWHQFLQVVDDCVLVLDGKWHLAAFDLDSGELRWIGRLRSPGCWAPVVYGRYCVVLSRQGHLAIFCPQTETKVWEGKIPGQYHQPPAISHGKLVAAGNHSGLIAFDIHPFYAS